MNASHAHSSLPIRLGAPPLRRWLQLWADALQHALQRLEQARQRRAEERAARSHHALMNSLDARTLRDIGLGDWAESKRDDAPSIWHRSGL